MQEQTQALIADSKTTGAKQDEEVRSKINDNVGDNEASDPVVMGRLDDESGVAWPDAD